MVDSHDHQEMPPRGAAGAQASGGGVRSCVNEVKRMEVLTSRGSPVGKPKPCRGRPAREELGIRLVWDPGGKVQGGRFQLSVIKHFHIESSERGNTVAFLWAFGV